MMILAEGKVGTVFNNNTLNEYIKSEAFEKALAYLTACPGASVDYQETFVLLVKQKKPKYSGGGLLSSMTSWAGATSGDKLKEALLALMLQDPRLELIVATDKALREFIEDNADNTDDSRSVELANEIILKIAEHARAKNKAGEADLDKLIQKNALIQIITKKLYKPENTQEQEELKIYSEAIYAIEAPKRITDSEACALIKEEVLANSLAAKHQDLSKLVLSQLELQESTPNIDNLLRIAVQNENFDVMTIERYMKAFNDAVKTVVASKSQNRFLASMRGSYQPEDMPVVSFKDSSGKDLIDLAFENQKIQRKNDIICTLYQTSLEASCKQKMIDLAIEKPEENGALFMRLLKLSEASQRQGYLKKLLETKDSNAVFLMKYQDEESLEILRGFYQAAELSLKSTLTNMAFQEKNQALIEKILPKESKALEDIVSAQMNLNKDKMPSDTWVHALIRANQFSFEDLKMSFEHFNQLASNVIDKRNQAKYRFQSNDSSFDVLDLQDKQGRNLLVFVSETMQNEGDKQKVISFLYQHALKVQKKDFALEVVRYFISKANDIVLRECLNQDANLLLQVITETDDLPLLGKLFENFAPKERLRILQVQDSSGKTVLEAKPGLISVWNKAEMALLTIEKDAKDQSEIADINYPVVMYQKPGFGILDSAQRLLLEAAAIHSVLVVSEKEEAMQFALLDNAGTRRISVITVLDQNLRAGTRCFALTFTDDQGRENIQILFLREYTSRNVEKALELKSEITALESIKEKAKDAGFDFQKISGALIKAIQQKKEALVLSFIARGFDGLNAQYAMGQVLLDLKNNQQSISHMPELQLMTLNTPSVASGLKTSVQKALLDFGDKKPRLRGYVAVVDGALFVKELLSIIPEESCTLTLVPNVDLKNSLQTLTEQYIHLTTEKSSIQNELKGLSRLFEEENRTFEALESAQNKQKAAERHIAAYTERFNKLSLRENSFKEYFACYQRYSGEIKKGQNKKNEMDQHVEQCKEDYDENRWVEACQSFLRCQKKWEKKSSEIQTLLYEMTRIILETTEARVDFSALEVSGLSPSRSVVPVDESLCLFSNHRKLQLKIAKMIEECFKNPNYLDMDKAANRVSDWELKVIEEATNKQKLDKLLVSLKVSQGLDHLRRGGEFIDQFIPPVITEGLDDMFGLEQKALSEASTATRHVVTGGIVAASAGIISGLENPNFVIGAGVVTLGAAAALVGGVGAQNLHHAAIGHRNLQKIIKILEKTKFKAEYFCQEIKDSCTILQNALGELSPLLIEKLGFPTEVVLFLNSIKPQTVGTRLQAYANKAKFDDYSDKGVIAPLAALTEIDFQALYSFYSQGQEHYEKLMFFCADINETLNDLYAVFAEIAPNSAKAFSAFWNAPSESPLLKLQKLLKMIKENSLTMAELKSSSAVVVTNGITITIERLSHFLSLPALYQLTRAIQPIINTCVERALASDGVSAFIDGIAERLVDTIESMQSKITHTVIAAADVVIHAATHQGATLVVKKGITWVAEKGTSQALSMAGGALLGTGVQLGIQLAANLPMGTLPKHLISGEFRHHLFQSKFGQKIVDGAATVVAAAYTAIDATPGVGTVTNNAIGALTAAQAAILHGGPVVQTASTLAGMCATLLMTNLATGAVGTSMAVFGASNAVGFFAAVLQERLTKNKGAAIAGMGGLGAATAKQVWEKAWLLRPTELKKQIEACLKTFEELAGTRDEKKAFIVEIIQNAFKQLVSIQMKSLEVVQAPLLLENNQSSQRSDPVLLLFASLPKTSLKESAAQFINAEGEAPMTYVRSALPQN